MKPFLKYKSFSKCLVEKILEELAIKLRVVRELPVV
jgi:hypothetical protein